jgi:hypothetical protein
MGLTVQRNLPDYAMIGNGLLCEILSDTPWTDAVSAQLVMQLSNNRADYIDGKGFTLEFGGSIQVEFLFKTSPDDTGLQLRIWAAAESKSEFYVHLIEDLLAYNYIRYYYTVSLDVVTDLLTITAKTAGYTGMIEHVENEVNCTVISTTAGADSTKPADYKVFMSLQEAITNGFTVYGSEIAPIDADFVGRTDFRNYFSDLVKFAFTWPKAANCIVGNALLNIVLMYAEHYNDQVRKLAAGSTSYLLPGGLKQKDFEALEAADDDYFNDHVHREAFLSWCPNNKITAWQTPERLYFLNMIGDHNAILKLKVYRDSTFESETETFTIETYTTRFNVIELLVGLHEMKPDISPVGLVKYDVWIQDETAKIVSETRTFVMDQIDHYKTRIFLFKNSFGAFETLRCTGVQAINDSMSRMTVERMENREYRTRLISSKNTEVVSQNTGWLQGAAQRRWLIDFMNSDEIYLADGDILQRIIITTAEIERETDKQFSFNAKFEFTSDMPDSFFSSL